MSATRAALQAIRAELDAARHHDDVARRHRVRAGALLRERGGLDSMIRTARALGVDARLLELLLLMAPAKARSQATYRAPE